MIKNFFQNLDRRDANYLLISGQAAILYGAATFSEDIDLWMEPSANNCERFLSALHDCKARYYKLTPPLTVEHLVHGHGFHFVLPGKTGSKVFLDLLGAPPRVKTFAIARRSARWMKTAWGNLPTIGLKDLVELKKTQRLEDYPIISKLALAWLQQPECKQTPADFRWAVENIYSLDLLTSLLEQHPTRVKSALLSYSRPIQQYGRDLLEKSVVSESIEKKVSTLLQQKMAVLQQADRHYWRKIISELKALRSTGQLMNDGSEV